MKNIINNSVLRTDTMSRNLFSATLRRSTIMVLALLTLLSFQSNAHSATDTCNDVGFANFETSGGGVVSALNAITFSGGGALVDWETSQDLTANTGVGGSNDFSSGCPCGNADATSCPDSNCNPDSTELTPPGTALDTCGPETSGFRGIIDPNGDTDFDNCENDGSDVDDFITFRARVDEDPQAGTQGHLDNEVWQFVIDLQVVDSLGGVVRTRDGWNDFLVSIDGSTAAGNGAVDELVVQFNNNGAETPAMGCTTQCNTTGLRTQDCEDVGTDCFVRDTFTACGEQLTGTPGCTVDDPAANCNKSFTRTVELTNSFTCSSNPQAPNEYYIDVMIPITAFTDQNGVRQIYCNTDFGVALSSSTTTQNTFLKDASPDCASDQACDFGGSTPVTLAYFNSWQTSGGVGFEWSTATEAGNLGFNIYGVINGSNQRLNKDTILSKAVDSLAPIDYTQTLKNVDADSFYISDVDLNGIEKLHGPFALGKSYGGKAKAEKIDWVKINTEVNTKKAVSIESSKLKALGKAAALKSKSSKLVETSAVALETEYPRASVKVAQDGVYRLYYQDLVDIGLDLGGVDTGSLALTNKGISQPIFVSSADNLFGAGDYIEFVGQSINTLYTSTNIYILQVNSAIAQRISTDSKKIRKSAAIEQSYVETLNIGNNNSYTFSSPGSDPWIDARLFARPSSPVTKVYSFDLDNLASANGGNLRGTLWGLTDFAANPDHHVIVKINGVEVENKIFNGLTLVDINADLDSAGAALQGTSNQLEVNLPADTAASFDIVDVDSFAVGYERNFIAKDGRLVYSDNAEAFEVQNLPSPDAIVYSKNGSSVSKHTNLEIANNGATYSVKFAGDKNKIINYFVFEEGSVLSPELEITPDTSDLKTGQAQYLIISHPTFINDLGDLISERQTQFSVKVAGVEAIYTEFNGGIFDPEPIRQYIDFAVNNLGTIHVLLVGGDSYDYHNYSGSGSFSFIPTFYAKVHQFANYAPSDALIADIDGDNVQDVSVGRFPVRTSAELANIIEKTLTYPAVNSNSAVFAADKNDGSLSFSNDSDNLIQNLPVGWSVDKAYLEGSSVADTKAILIDSINDGRALTSFFGHSSFGQWTFSGLFSLSDAQGLTNVGKPTVVTQYGCWNTYFVDPALNTLGHKFLLSGLNGAAAVTGPTSLSTVTSDRGFGNILIQNLFSGQTIGEAIRDSKQDLASSGQSVMDVIIGWNLLGDPALVITE